MYNPLNKEHCWHLQMQWQWGTTIKHVLEPDCYLTLSGRCRRKRRICVDGAVAEKQQLLKVLKATSNPDGLDVSEKKQLLMNSSTSRCKGVDLRTGAIGTE